MVYNFTNLTNANSFLGIVQYVNESTENIFGIGILVSFWFVLFIISKKYFSDVAFITSLYITTIVAWLFRIMGLIPDYLVFGVTILTAIITAVSYFKS